jgi:hypothetical protein
MGRRSAPAASTRLSFGNGVRAATGHDATVASSPAQAHELTNILSYRMKIVCPGPGALAEASLCHPPSGSGCDPLLPLKSPARLNRRRILPRGTGALVALLGLGILLAATGSSAVTLDELLKEPKLTPERFMSHFADFKFRLSRAVQKPADFLASKAGDCDDFATLADRVFRERGYTPRLVVVMMEQDVHVVCFIKEINGFLDFNHRQDAQPVVASDGTLKDIGAKVAAYFRSNWRTVSEFKYENGRPKYLLTAFR